MIDRRKNTDWHLVKELKKGSGDAFEELFNKYNKKLYYFAKGYLGSKEDAEGLVQEVFITIWRKRKGLKDDLSFNSYIFTITYNNILKYFRTKSLEKKYLDSFVSDYVDETNNTSFEVEYNNLREFVDDAIEELPEKRKMVFKLSRIDGLSNVEIAKKLNLSKRTVETHILLAAKTLRKKLSSKSIALVLFFYLFV